MVVALYSIVCYWSILIRQPIDKGMAEVIGNENCPLNETRAVGEENGRDKLFSTSERVEELESLQLSQLHSVKEGPEKNIMGNEVSNTKKDITAESAEESESKGNADTTVVRSQTVDMQEGENGTVADAAADVDGENLTEDENAMEVEVEIVNGVNGIDSVSGKENEEVTESADMNNEENEEESKMKNKTPKFLHSRTPNRRLTRTRSGMGSASLRKTIFSPSQTRRRQSLSEVTSSPRLITKKKAEMSEKVKKRKLSGLSPQLSKKRQTVSSMDELFENIQTMLKDSEDRQSQQFRMRYPHLKQNRRNI